jgi:hypothetical protein
MIEGERANVRVVRNQFPFTLKDFHFDVRLVVNGC